MTRVRVLLIVLLAGMAGAGLGYGLSHALHAPSGGPHHCPEGAPPSACVYPPDQALWTKEWIIGCTLAGLIIAAMLLHRLTNRRSRR
jgi:hypothetical protein